MLDIRLPIRDEFDLAVFFALGELTQKKKKYVPDFVPKLEWIRPKELLNLLKRKYGDGVRFAQVANSLSWLHHVGLVATEAEFKRVKQRVSTSSFLRSKVALTYRGRILFKKMFSKGGKNEKE